MARVDGLLRPIGGEAALNEEQVSAVLDVLLDRRQTESFEEDLDIDFAFAWAGVARIRGNAYYQRSLPAVALRLIPDRIPTFDQLNDAWLGFWRKTPVAIYTYAMIGAIGKKP